ncbi:uncharacterized protein LOC132903851 [Amyelois transitella]|uniref:uncharacterized protein LOC132903851 n=1 Tax=Amyelois transitella TaxID=680683 RepID=UPI00298FBA11|nr:uncharacterized protein LOC132903851 [Amyelois transitella]
MGEDASGMSPAAPLTQRLFAAAKRVLSPDENTVAATPKRRPAEKRIVAAPPIADPESDSEMNVDGMLHLATARELLSRANREARGVSTIMSGPTSKLNKADQGAITSHLQTMLEIVGQLALIAEAGSSSLEKTKQANIMEARRAQRAEAEAERARREASEAAARQAAAAQMAASAAAVGRGGSYADRVRTPAAGGPLIAVYPTGGEVKTAEETKKLLKTSVAPAALKINIEKIRRVGNAGVLIQGKTKEDLARLRSALPPTLRANDVQGRMPLIAVRGVEGRDTKFEDFIGSVHEQNFKEDPNWTLPNIKKNCRLAFRKSREGGTRTTMVLACTPAFRLALLQKGCLYVEWEVCPVGDFTTAIKCGKCQTYGHPEKKCKEEKPTCSKCGTTGHKEADCKSESVRCATCKKFGRREAEAHITGAGECPARIHAERRMAEAAGISL